MKLHGRINDARSGAPLSDVVVTVTGYGIEVERTVVTGVDGGFALPDVPVGTYSLHLEKEGHHPTDIGGVDDSFGEFTMDPVAAAPASSPAEPGSIARARVAYAAYGRTTDFKNFQGNPMPEFDELPEKIRHAWVNAAAAVTCDHVDVEVVQRVLVVLDLKSGQTKEMLAEQLAAALVVRPARHGAF